MFNVNRFKIYCDTLANKDQTGADFKPSDFNSVLPQNVNSLIEQYFGKPKWATLPYLGNERNQAIKDYIANSEINLKVKLPTTDGVITLPPDYLHLQSLTYQYFKKKEVVCNHCGCNKCVCVNVPEGFQTGDSKCEPELSSIKINEEITIVNNSQWNQLFTDANLYPDIEHAYGQFIGNNQVEIEPQQIVEVYLRYLRYPKTAKWGYTIVNGIAVYDPATSVNIELPEILLPELACIQLAGIGIHTREYWLQQLYDQKNIAGT